MCITLTLKQGDFAFVGKKAYLSQQVKKSTSKGNIALALISLVGQILVLSTSQMCSLDFNHYCLLWRYDNIYVGDDIKCKSIELFLYNFDIIVVCKYICEAFSGQDLLTRQSDKETWLNE